MATAASLRPAIEALADLYMAKHADVEIRVQAGGSNALARRALELAEPIDMLVLADASLFDALLEPQWTDFHVALATERMVLAHGPKAKRATQIDSRNWPEVLLQRDVRIGMADPDKAPLGYRTMLTWLLAERNHPELAAKLRRKVGRRHVWPDASALLAPLEAGAIDYAFLYGASAQAAGLTAIELPPEVNLGDLSMRARYATVAVTVVGNRPDETLERRGEPILYGASVAKQARSPEAAARFLGYLLSEAGARVLAEHGFTPVQEGPDRLNASLPGPVQAALAAFSGAQAEDPRKP